MSPMTGSSSRECWLKSVPSASLSSPIARYCIVTVDLLHCMSSVSQPFFNFRFSLHSQMQSLTSCQCSVCCGCFQQHFTIAVRDKHIRDMVCPVCWEPDINDPEHLNSYFSTLDIQVRQQMNNEVTMKQDNMSGLQINRNQNNHR